MGDYNAASPSFPASFSDASHLDWPSCTVQLGLTGISVASSMCVSTCSLVFNLPYTWASVVAAMLLSHAGWLCVHGGRSRNRRTGKGVEIWCLCRDGKTAFLEMWRSRENNGKVSVIRQRERLDFEGSLKIQLYPAGQGEQMHGQ